MIYFLRGSEAELDAEEQDDLHMGDFTAAFRTSYRSGDGSFEGGLWQFAGKMTTPAQDGYEMAVVLTEGSAEIECEGNKYSLRPGDLFVFEGPTDDYHVTSDGFRAAYLRRWREPRASS